MKIDERISNYMSLLVGDAAKAPARPQSQSAPTVQKAGEDNVSISPVASQLTDDEARRERLFAIRRQLSEGTYNISGKDVADKIIKVLQG